MENMPFSVDSEGYVKITVKDFYDFCQQSAWDFPSFLAAINHPNFRKYDENLDDWQMMHPDESVRKMLQETFPMFDWSEVSLHWDT